MEIYFIENFKTTKKFDEKFRLGPSQIGIGKYVLYIAFENFKPVHKFNFLRKTSEKFNKISLTAILNEQTVNKPYEILTVL